MHTQVSATQNPAQTPKTPRGLRHPHPLSRNGIGPLVNCTAMKAFKMASHTSSVQSTAEHNHQEVLNVPEKRNKPTAQLLSHPVKQSRRTQGLTTVSQTHQNPSVWPCTGSSLREQKVLENRECLSCDAHSTACNTCSVQCYHIHPPA